jgi:hypothetical protein
VISIALGAVWLDEKLSSSPAGIAGEIIALIVMIGGIIVIAHRAPHVAPAVHGASRRQQPARHR